MLQYISHSALYFFISDVSKNCIKFVMGFIPVISDTPEIFELENIFWQKHLNQKH